MGYRSSRSQMFFKIGVLKKFRNIHRKTPVLESLFNLTLTFSHNSGSLATLNQSRNKTDVTLILSVITKEKSDHLPKSEKRFWFLTTLIAFIIAYVISIMRTDFSMANKCVLK